MSICSSKMISTIIFCHNIKGWTYVSAPPPPPQKKNVSEEKCDTPASNLIATKINCYNSSYYPDQILDQITVCST